MTTLFVLLLAAALVAFVLTKKSQAPLKLVGNVKKIEETVAKVGEVATNALDVNGDGKVDLKDAVAVVKKTRKPRAKKITGKKKD